MEEILFGWKILTFLAACTILASRIGGRPPTRKDEKILLFYIFVNVLRSPASGKSAGKGRRKLKIMFSHERWNRLNDLILMIHSSEELEELQQDFLHNLYYLVPFEQAMFHTIRATGNNLSG